MCCNKSDIPEIHQEIENLHENRHENQQNHRPHPILPNVKGWRRMKLRFVVSALRKLLSRIENYSIFSLEIIDSYSLHPRLIIK